MLFDVRPGNVDTCQHNKACRQRGRVARAGDTFLPCEKQLRQPERKIEINMSG